MFLFRRIRKRIKGIFMILAAITVAFSAGGNDMQSETTSETKGLILSTTKNETTVRDVSVSTSSSTEKETFIILADDMTFIKGKGASFSDGVVTVSKSGTYLFKGELSDGRIVVDLSGDGAEAVLKFYGVNVSSSTGAPVSVVKAQGCTVLDFAKGTENTFSDTDERVFSYNDDEGDSAVIFSRGDIVIKGEGTLNIEAKFNKGIFSKKDISLKDANLNIVSFDDGIRSNEIVLVENSKLNVSAGGDGIHIGDNNRDIKGKILVYDSEISLDSEFDGIESAGDVLLCDGKIDITAAGGSTGRFYKKKHGDIFAENGGPDKNKNDIFTAARATADSTAIERVTGRINEISGISAANEVVLSDITVKINSAQHGICGGSIEIENGYCLVKSDGNGLYSSGDVSVDSTDMNVMAYCNGVEGENIRLVDGRVFISAPGEALFSPKGDEGIEIESAKVQTERAEVPKAIFSKP